MNKRKFVVILLMIFFIISNTFGEDKWQKGKKYSDLYSPKDNNINKIDHGIVEHSCYLYKGKEYYLFYPLIENTTRVDTEIPSNLVKMYKISLYSCIVLSTVCILSGGTFIVNGALDLFNETIIDYYHTYSPIVETSFRIMLISGGLALISFGINICLENNIRNYHNKHINEKDKTIGLKLSYKF